MWLVEDLEADKITYEMALEIVRKGATAKNLFDPKGLHKLNCEAVFGKQAQMMARQLGISNTLMFQYLNGKSNPNQKMLMHIGISTGISTTLLKLLFTHQEREFKRWKGIIDGPSEIPEYLLEYFLPWQPRAAPPETEKSRARDERRRVQNVNRDEAGQSQDGWIRKRYTGPAFAFLG